MTFTYKVIIYTQRTKVKPKVAKGAAVTRIVYKQNLFTDLFIYLYTFKAA